MVTVGEDLGGGKTQSCGAGQSETFGPSGLNHLNLVTKSIDRQPFYNHLDFLTPSSESYLCGRGLTWAGQGSGEQVERQQVWGGNTALLHTATHTNSFRFIMK